MKYTESYSTLPDAKHMLFIGVKKNNITIATKGNGIFARK